MDSWLQWGTSSLSTETAAGPCVYQPAMPQLPLHFVLPCRTRCTCHSQEKFINKWKDKSPANGQTNYIGYENHFLQSVYIQRKIYQSCVNTANWNLNINHLYPYHVCVPGYEVWTLNNVYKHSEVAITNGILVNESFLQHFISTIRPFFVK